MNIILASSSPRRRRLLRQIGLTFDVITARQDEHIPEGADPARAVKTLAARKSEAVAKNCDDALVIGADTIVVLDGQILGKPADATEAETMLRSLSGKTHQVFTGVSLILCGANRKITRRHTFHEQTDVSFGELSGEEIRAYIAGGSPMDKAGAYGIQDDLGALFVRKIHGDYYNVVGFPLYRFYREVNKLAPGTVTLFEKATNNDITGHHP